MHFRQPLECISDTQKLEALIALSFYFKQINNNLDNFRNPSSSDNIITPQWIQILKVSIVGNKEKFLKKS